MIRSLRHGNEELHHARTLTYSVENKGTEGDHVSDSLIDLDDDEDDSEDEDEDRRENSLVRFAYGRGDKTYLHDFRGAGMARFDRVQRGLCPAYHQSEDAKG